MKFNNIFNELSVPTKVGGASLSDYVIVKEDDINETIFDDKSDIPLLKELHENLGKKPRNRGQKLLLTDEDRSVFIGTTPVDQKFDHKKYLYVIFSGRSGNFKELIFNVFAGEMEDVSGLGSKAMQAVVDATTSVEKSGALKGKIISFSGMSTAGRLRKGGKDKNRSSRTNIYKRILIKKFGFSKEKHNIVEVGFKIYFTPDKKKIPDNIIKDMVKGISGYSSWKIQPHEWPAIIKALETKSDIWSIIDDIREK